MREPWIFLVTGLVTLAGMAQEGPKLPSEPGLYLARSDGFSKLLGEIVTFKRSASLLVSGATAGIKARKENVQLPGPHAATRKR